MIESILITIGIKTTTERSLYIIYMKNDLLIFSDVFKNLLKKEKILKECLKHLNPLIKQYEVRLKKRRSKQ